MIEALPGQIVNYQPMAESVRIIFETQENLSPETVGYIHSLKDKHGHFFFAEQNETLPEKIDAADLPPIKLEHGEKSASQRLRAVMFVFWEQRIKSDPLHDYANDFELYYRRQMERMINQIKEKLT